MTLAYLVLLTAAGTQEHGLAPPTRLVKEARVVPPVAGNLRLRLRCGQDHPSQGTVQIELPGTGTVIQAPIDADGLVTLPPHEDGWAQVRSVEASRAGAREFEESLCLDPPVAVRTDAAEVTLNLRPAFTIQSFGPRVPDAWASGTALLIREAGVSAARVAAQCEVADSFGQIQFGGLRSGAYRIVLPWRRRDYVSIAELRFAGAPRRMTDVEFGPVEIGKEAAAAILPSRALEGDDLATWRGRVVDPTGVPVPHAIVRLMRSALHGPRLGGSADVAPESDAVDVICDGAGLFELHGARPGTYLVGARRQPHPLWSEAGMAPLSNGGAPNSFESVIFPGRVEAEGGASTLGTAVSLPPEGSIRGRVTGAAHTGLHVIATSEAHFGQLATPVAASGAFSFDRVPCGSYWLHLTGGTESVDQCLAAPVATLAGDESVELRAIEGVRIDVVAPFPTTRRSRGWVQVVDASPGEERAESGPFRHPQRVAWRGIGVTSIEGLAPGRYRVTFREDAADAGREPLRFAEGSIEIREGSIQPASVQLDHTATKKLTLYNDDPDHSIRFELHDREGPLFWVDVPAASDRTITAPIGTFPALPPDLRAVVRAAPGSKAWSRTIPEEAWLLRYPGQRQ